MAAEFGSAALPFGSEVFGREEVVVLDIDREIQSSHDGGANVECCLDVGVHVELLDSCLLQVTYFK